MEVLRKKRFIKSFMKLDINIQNKFIERLKIFKNNPHDRILNNHTLLGEYLGYRSIDITGDYRAVFKELSQGKYEFIEFTDIGTHSQLYK